MSRQGEKGLPYCHGSLEDRLQEITICKQKLTELKCYACGRLHITGCNFHDEGQGRYAYPNHLCPKCWASVMDDCEQVALEWGMLT